MDSRHVSPSPPWYQRHSATDLSRSPPVTTTPFGMAVGGVGLSSSVLSTLTVSHSDSMSKLVATLRRMGSTMESAASDFERLFFKMGGAGIISGIGLDKLRSESGASITSTSGGGGGGHGTDSNVSKTEEILKV